MGMLLFRDRRPYHHLNVVKISRVCLQSNYEQLTRLHPEAKIAPVLKSNAYGYGITTVAAVADNLGAPFLIVDSLYEAYELAKLHVKTPILIMGYVHPDSLAARRLPFHYCVYDLEVMRALNRYQPGSKVHLFVDTGMTREGVRLSDLRAFIVEAKKLKNVHICGMAAHLANADCQHDTFTATQVKNFKAAVKIATDEGLNLQWRHTSASAGAYKLNNDLFNLIRVGIAWYGISPLAANDKNSTKLELQQALEFQSTLVQIKHISKGSLVGYNCTYRAKRDLTVGILSAGYYDGVDRRLSNVGVVTLRGIACPIIGRVSMNMTTVDLSKVPEAIVGEMVTIYSQDPSAPNSLPAAAVLCHTIPYELLVHLAESIHREVV